MQSKIKFTAALLISIFVFSQCVPTKQFDELQVKNNKCEDELELVKNENKNLTVQNTELKSKVDVLNKRMDAILNDSADCDSKLRSINLKYDKLNRQYTDLQTTQDQLLTGNISETKKLLVELQNTQSGLIEKEDELRKLEDNLRAEQYKLNLFKKELDEKNARLVELESILYKKDSVVNALKETVSKALLGFTDMGLAIEMKNGKVYVSLDEQLLFKSGSTDVDPKGVSALKKLAEVLEVNTDINIMVEGHTDDVPYISGSTIKDNWDLSVKRATAIVRILMNNSKIEGSRIIAAGRSKYQPIINSKAPDARRKNRRTEIILTPKLDELFKILETN